MDTIILSSIAVIVVGLVVMLLVYSAKGRRKYLEFVAAAKAVVRVSDVKDIDAVVQGFDEIENKYGFHFVSALKSLDSTWSDVGIQRRHFENIIDALALSQEALRVATDDEWRGCVEEARRQLVGQIVIARQLLNQQAILGTVARIDNITGGLLSDMRQTRDRAVRGGTVGMHMKK